MPAVVALLLASPAIAQDWRQWSQQNPTYPGGVSDHVVPATGGAVVKKRAGGIVRPVSAKIVKEHDLIWLEGTIKNFTHEPVTNVYIGYEVRTGYSTRQTLDSGVLPVNPGSPYWMQRGGQISFRRLINAEGYLRITGVAWQYADGTVERFTDQRVLNAYID